MSLAWLPEGVKCLISQQIVFHFSYVQLCHECRDETTLQTYLCQYVAQVSALGTVKPAESTGISLVKDELVYFLRTCKDDLIIFSFISGFYTLTGV